jgi:hypothetical protein
MINERLTFGARAERPMTAVRLKATASEAEFEPPYERV